MIVPLRLLIAFLFYQHVLHISNKWSKQKEAEIKSKFIRRTHTSILSLIPEKNGILVTLCKVFLYFLVTYKLGKGRFNFEKLSDFLPKNKLRD